MIVAPAVHSLVADILAPLGRCISLRFLCISHGIGSSKRPYPQSSVFLLFVCIPCPCLQQLWACCPGLLGHCHGCKFTGKEQKSGLLLHEQKTPPSGAAQNRRGNNDHTAEGANSDQAKEEFFLLKKVKGNILPIKESCSPGSFPPPIPNSKSICK